ncbi:nucleoside deaminase [Paraclostridium sordellii]|uniref:tRNA-specific adenosine deaminase n=1 Tax=Paraclostridium sordellii TaxID=1505 RepID=A0A0C7I9D8_PARSO|nr:nucleoside deaminase [Paeniclostridium sordellii]CEN79422.1 transfer RNA specific adenosine deaminase [[Clostridium] sordellii] [Paeniclostridium sordellii]CEO11457.1 transfer RNA specific adenosine deaminase [[Clostridium] sordellii] [Paeniclostridium sordellii]CEP87762.1 transfer RNA specific adenosine deaminase [[Clostridium] sordellii] [Paeniclostridium sordellii]CEP96228.1 transfer RNA specific adenosine deaminase [[Clostridium] sordellii] [Paeniclostridium sordellii]CEQ00546.1 transfe
MDKSFYMNEAIKEAYKAYEKGETPIGAVIVKDGKIIARAHNLTETLNDATAHAEILAIRKASDYLGGWRLINCDLYVTMEPCIMCSGAIVQSRIKKLIIGTKHIKNLNIEKQHKFKIDYFDTCNIEVIFDVLQEQCSDILQKFFKELRNR